MLQVMWLEVVVVQAVAEKVGERALPLTCASNSTADWKRCIPLLERLESAMLTAGGELHKMSDRLQSTIICGERQCFNLTAAASADEQVRELIQQAQAAVKVEKDARRRQRLFDRHSPRQRNKQRAGKKSMAGPSAVIHASHHPPTHSAAPCACTHTQT